VDEAELERHSPGRERRRMDRLGRFAVAACRAALADAGLTADEQVGVVLGTGLGPARSTAEFFLPTIDSGPGGGSPAVFPNTVFNAAAGQVAMVLGAKGPTSTATAAHAAGASALCIGYDLLRSGRTQAVLCPAVDELTEQVVNGYLGLPLFSGRHGRDCTLAEGGIALVLERESAARARGARILAELAGHATASDALGVARWDPQGRGLERAMRGALEAAGIGPAELTAVWTNAAGLEPVDRPEELALSRMALPAGCRMESPRRTLGEPLGAGAQLSAALALTGWADGTPGGPALVNSCSLGGTHTSLVLLPAL
jgi:3-oxoacyl-[acyl-carrier-protein] synthase II